MKIYRMSIISAFLVFMLSNTVFGAILILSENFEDGQKWNCSDRWDKCEYFGDEWDIVKSKSYSGSYSAKSKKPGKDGLEDSILSFEKLPTDANVKSIFIRFMFLSGSTNLCYCRLQTNRWTAKSGEDEIEMGIGYPPCGDGKNHRAHMYKYSGAQNITGWGAMWNETNWNEYAMMVDYENNRIIYWKNAKNYSIKDPSAVVFNNATGAKHYRVTFGAYYKGDFSDYADINDPSTYTFYLDDIEIWRDGVPPPKIAKTEFIKPPGGLTLIKK